MTREVEYTDEFGLWWIELDEQQQDRIAASVSLLAGQGPLLGFPHTSGMKGSRHSHMRELRVQSGGSPVRIFFAFDPRRTDILLIGGDKTGRARFYEDYVAMERPLRCLSHGTSRGGLAMTGRHKFSDLVANMPAERRARVDQITEELRCEMNLTQLRTARLLSQAALAEILHVEQPAVAKLEKRTDMYVSTLRRFVEAMGGELEITARFDDRAVRIKIFRDLGERGPA